jgi:hypothetical protein
MLSEDTIGRLVNWKFTQAVRAAKEQPDDARPTMYEMTMIRALGAIFGNIGWFDGWLANVVRMAVKTLVGDEK